MLSPALLLLATLVGEGRALDEAVMQACTGNDPATCPSDAFCKVPQTLRVSTFGDELHVRAIRYETKCMMNILLIGHLGSIVGCRAFSEPDCGGLMKQFGDDTTQSSPLKAVGERLNESPSMIIEQDINLNDPNPYSPYGQAMCSTVQSIRINQWSDAAQDLLVALGARVSKGNRIPTTKPNDGSVHRHVLNAGVSPAAGIYDSVLGVWEYPKAKNDLCINLPLAQADGKPNRPEVATYYNVWNDLQCAELCHYQHYQEAEDSKKCRVWTRQVQLDNAGTGSGKHRIATCHLHGADTANATLVNNKFLKYSADPNVEQSDEDGDAYCVRRDQGKCVKHFYSSASIGSMVLGWSVMGGSTSVSVGEKFAIAVSGRNLPPKTHRPRLKIVEESGKEWTDCSGKHSTSITGIQFSSKGDVIGSPGPSTASTSELVWDQLRVLGGSAKKFKVCLCIGACAHVRDFAPVGANNTFLTVNSEQFSYQVLDSSGDEISMMRSDFGSATLRVSSDISSSGPSTVCNAGNGAGQQATCEAITGCKFKVSDNTCHLGKDISGCSTICTIDSDISVSSINKVVMTDINGEVVKSLNSTVTPSGHTDRAAACAAGAGLYILSDGETVVYHAGSDTISKAATISIGGVFSRRGGPDGLRPDLWTVKLVDANQRDQYVSSCQEPATQRLNVNAHYETTPVKVGYRCGPSHVKFAGLYTTVGACAEKCSATKGCQFFTYTKSGGDAQKCYQASLPGCSGANGAAALNLTASADHDFYGLAAGGDVKKSSSQSIVFRSDPTGVRTSSFFCVMICH